MNNDIPFKDQLTDGGGLVSRAWSVFFRNVYELLKPLGVEKSFEILNNQASAVNIEGLKFDKRYTSYAFIDVLIQRTTSSAELLESGVLTAVYRPVTDTWVIRNIGTMGPDSSGVTLTIDSTGQIKYTSTNLAGTPSISRIIFRSRMIAAKSQKYSAMGEGS